MSKDYTRICFVNPGFNIKKPISLLMEILKQNDYKISIFIPKIKYGIKREKTRHYDNFQDINLLSYPVWTRSSGYNWPIPTNFEFFKKSWRILKENDIIHVWVPFYPNTFILCLLKLLFFKKKKLILTMDTFPSYSFKLSSKLNTIFKIFFKTLGKIPLLASNYVIIYGNSFIKYTEEIGISKRKLKINPTGISITPRGSERNIRTDFNIKENEKIVLFVGLHNRRKGIDLIIKTAYLLKDENIKFVLVGDGSIRDKSIKIASKLGLNEKMIFVGNRLDIHNFYNQADIFFLPSRGEGLAGVLMEAMIYKVPIVSSNIAGTRDLINHLENGILCEVEDYRSYAKAILTLLKDEDMKNRFIKNGLETIKSKYLWENNKRNFESLYKEIISK